MEEIRQDRVAHELKETKVLFDLVQAEVVQCSQSQDDHLYLLLLHSLKFLLGSLLNLLGILHSLAQVEQEELAVDVQQGLQVIYLLLVRVVRQIEGLVHLLWLGSSSGG